MRPFLKFLIPILIIICFVITSCALQMDVPEADGTGHYNLKTQETMIASSSDKISSDYLEGYFTIQSGKYYFFHLESDLNYNKRNRYKIKRGYHLTLFTEKDSVVSFMNSVDTTADKYLMTFGTNRRAYWTARTLYVMPFDDVKKLATLHFTSARLQTSDTDQEFGVADNEHDFSISTKESKAINRLASLALQNGPGR